MMTFKKSTIGQGCKVGDGAHASIPRKNSGHLYLSAKNFTRNGLNVSDVSFISEEDFNKYFNANSKALTKPAAGDLILGIIGAGLGVPYLIKEEDKEFGVSSSVAIIRTDPESLSPAYLYYWMTGPYFQKQIKNIQSGSAQGFLSLEMIRSLHVIMPPLTIQQKIASILSAYDELIENNKQRIKLLEEMAEEIYKEWFVRFRFPGYESTRFFDEKGKEVPHGTPGALPEGWNRKDFQFFGKVITGKTPSTENTEYFGGQVSFRKTPDMNGVVYVIHTNETLTAQGAESQQNKFIKKNSLMVSCIGSAGVYALASENCQTNQQINSILFNKEYYAFYFYSLARDLKDHLNNLGSNGATMTNVNKAKFESIKATNPSKEILIMFNDLVKNNFELILNLQHKNQLLQQTRDLLLPRLISGKLSVQHLIDRESEPLAMAAEPEAGYGQIR